MSGHVKLLDPIPRQHIPATSKAGKVQYFCPHPNCHTTVQECFMFGGWLDADTGKTDRGQHSYMCELGHWGPWKDRKKTSTKKIYG